VPSTYRLTASETVTVLRHDPHALVVEATYGPAGTPPPAHVHPAQDERFTVLDGALTVRVAGEERVLAAGDVLDVPRATPHAMWNAAPDAPARVAWETTPAGRTREWFALLDASGAARRPRPDPVAMAPLLRAYDDTFRLAGPRWLLRPAIAVGTAVARLTRRGVDVRPT
jgi:quercetin dioxygenase-like cupin family protein